MERTPRKATRPAGPPAPKVTRRTVAAAAIVAAIGPVPPQAPVCCCVGGPITIAVFRPPAPGQDAVLAEIQQVHRGRSDGCLLPPERVDPQVWLRRKRRARR